PRPDPRQPRPACFRRWIPLPDRRHPARDFFPDPRRRLHAPSFGRTRPPRTTRIARVSARNFRPTHTVLNTKLLVERNLFSRDAPAERLPTRSKPAGESSSLRDLAAPNPT